VFLSLSVSYPSNPRGGGIVPDFGTQLVQLVECALASCNLTFVSKDLLKPSIGSALGQRGAALQCPGNKLPFCGSPLVSNESFMMLACQFGFVKV